MMPAAGCRRSHAVCQPVFGVMAFGSGVDAPNEALVWCSLFCQERFKLFLGGMCRRGGSVAPVGRAIFDV